MPEAKTSGASASDGTARSRTAAGTSSTHNGHNQGSQSRTYTPDQKAAVLRIRRCSPTAFYEILDIQKTCTDSEVKKAYRKLSLLTHPDKNGHEHADEAFKMVARAFSVLGDKEKRDKFDRFGTDPDSRFESARAAAREGTGMGGFGGRPRGGGFGGWEEEISPEEMFARFFGGGGGGMGGGFGGPFGGMDGGQFFFNLGGMGGPGIRVHQFGGGRPRARPRNPGQEEPPASMLGTILGLLPIIILFIFPIISSIFSGLTTITTPATPSMVFDQPYASYTVERMMPNYKTKYYLNKADIKSYTPAKFNWLDRQAEVVFVQQLRIECEKEMQRKQELKDQATGWFSYNKDKMELANNFPMPQCRRLNSLNK
ncbi:Chaperone protein dnaJ [Podospora pseudopauciseta]|uniref:Chaperone protein dnaJ n=1 Tax=Podospora pseudopauciseta TaxID=2093780 RepID=A0ABR0HGV7_9PEZI|nr:Chaperone protein dnaJ [Podospora pseudopauciseta]